MKNLNKLSILAFSSLLVLSSCETTELDLTVNPNALNPAQASTDLFINNIQEDFASWVDDVGDVGARLTRVAYLGGDRIHKSSTSIMRLSKSSIKQRLLGIRTSALPELLKFLNFLLF